MQYVRNFAIAAAGFTIGGFLMHKKMEADKNQFKSEPYDLRSGQDMKTAAREQNEYNNQTKRRKSALKAYKPSDLNNSSLKDSQNFFQKPKLDEKRKSRKMKQPFAKAEFEKKGNQKSSRKLWKL